MGSIPFALSVHHFITSVGADAGFASIIGLAVLVLLYFAQARETSHLREHAEDLAEQLSRVESRLSQVSRQQAPVAPAPASVSIASRVAAGVGAAPGQAAPVPAAARSGSAPRPVTAAAAAPAPAAPVPAVAGAPAPPAGVAAPALAAATRLIPAGTPSHEPPDEAAPAGTPPPASIPRPATAAGASNGIVQERARAAATSTTGRPPHPSARETGRTVQPPSRGPLRPTGAGEGVRRPLVPPRAPAARGSGTPRWLLALIGALIIAGIVAALLIVTSSGGGSQAASSSQTTNAPSGTRPKTAAPVPSSVTVAVLNGTASSGLAHRVATSLGAQGYRQGTIATASDQTRTATVISYLPRHKRAALAVASALKLGPASVQPVDSNTQAVACPPPGACSVTVVVTVGADLAASH